MPEVDYVVITAGTYDLLIETVCEDNEALLRFLAERLRSIDGRARDRDVRLPAPGQADLPVRHPLGAGRPAPTTERARRNLLPDRTGAIRSPPDRSALPDKMGLWKVCWRYCSSRSSGTWSCSA